MQAIYAAESRSLAALEVLVHYDVLPQDFVLTQIEIPDGLGIHVVDAGVLPDGWDAEPASGATQDIGRRWASEGRSAVLSVPSSVVPWERTFVINPLHAEFGKLLFSPSVPFRFDARLK